MSPSVPTILPLPVPGVDPETGPPGIGVGTPAVRAPVTDFPRLSVLDLVPVRSDQTSADALASMRELARAADDLGFHRYWVAEHHNMPAVAATNPPVLVAMVAAATGTLRVGSGGVMLPNHAPLVVAEQFALLEAAYPGRIDLGLGRAPGTDPVTSFALRHGAGGVTDDAVSRFPDYVADILTMMAPEGAQISVQGHRQVLRATPRAGSVADVWLLGSSHYSAQLAAERGLPYVFAHHFSGSGTAEALELYRSSFRPSEHLDRPRTFLTVNASVADSTEEAYRRALPQLQMMLALRTGQPLGPQALVEEAEKVELPPSQRDLLDKMATRYVIGETSSARERVAELAATFDVDEVMVVPVSAAHVGSEPASNPTRVETLRRLAEV
jgi:luciferase family oxidoreductase group 1